MDCCWWIAVAALTPFAIGARPDGVREKSAATSDFPLVHATFVAGRLRGVGFGHPPASPAAGAERPFACEFALDVTVDVDELDAVDDTDDEEFVRWRVFRGMNMVTPLTSSDELIEFSDWPPLIHPGRLRFVKLGGLATAVMRMEAGDSGRGR